MENTKQKTAAQLREELRSGEGNAREALASLFDGGSFAELGAFVRKAGGNADFEGVITGYGAVNGRLTFAFAQDSTRSKGAFGMAAADKIIRLYDAALKNEAPVVGMFDSAGAYVLEGVGALAGYGKLMKKIDEACGIIPQIAVIAGPCTGCAAVAASMFDFTVAAEDNGAFGVSAPFLTRAAVAKDAGTPKAEAAKGSIDLLAKDAAAAMGKVKSLLAAMPQSVVDGPVFDDAADDADRATPELAGILSAAGCDMKKALAAICDNGSFFEIGEGYAPEMLVGFAAFNGIRAGVVASQPSVKNGMLTEAAALKVSSFIDFCGRFDIPLLTVAASAGVDVASEKGAYAAALASLASSYASFDAAKVTLIAGPTYGASVALLGSKALGADMVLAIDAAAAAAMAPESAVQFFHGKEIAAAKDPDAAKADYLAKYTADLASPLAAARDGAIDDVVSYDECRQRIVSAFELLTAKYGG